MTTFALQRSESDKEKSSLRVASIKFPEKYNIQYFSKPSEVSKDFVPAGNIDWVEGVLGKVIKPDYYPEWLKPIWNRNIWYQDTWPMEKGVFVKPSDKHKRFKATITTGTYKGKKKGPYVCSEVVKFDDDEWRLYISNGEIKYIGWYSEIDKEDVSFCKMLLSMYNLNIPEDYCGAMDIGFVDNDLTLVECNSPYSCGWYGKLDDGNIYADWLIEGYKYIKRI